MNFLAISLAQKNTQKQLQWNVMLAVAMALITLLVLTLINLGFNIFVYLLVMPVIGIMIFFVPSLGLPIILLGTMLFQAWFTLSPIVFRDASYKLYPLDVIFLFTIGSYIFHHLFSKNPPKFYIKRLGWVFLIFFILVGAWFLRAVVDGGADTALAFSSFKNYVFYGLLYFLITYSIRSVQDLKKIIKVLLVGGYGVMVFVFLGLIRGQGIWTELNVLSTEGIRFLSFPHAFYLSIVFIVSLVLYVYRLRPQQASIIALWMHSLGLVVSMFRHLWAAVLATVMILFVLLPKTANKLLWQFIAKNLALLTFVSVFFGLVYLLFPVSDFSLALNDLASPLYERIASIVETTSDDSANFRYRAWAAAQENLIDNPLFGIGFGHDLTVDFDRYRLVIEIRELHNSLLVLIVQMGILAFAVFASALVLVVKYFYKAWRKRGMYWPYQLAFFAAWILFMGASFWEPYFETNFTGIFFWILTGLFIVSLRLDDQQHVSA